MRRYALLLAAAGIALASRPAAGGAQTVAPTRAEPPRGCRGDRTDYSALFAAMPGGGEPLAFRSYGVVKAVEPGSPAELAGLRPADVVLAEDGVDVAGGTRVRRRNAEGDTIRLLVERNRTENLSITLVLGHREPPVGTPSEHATCRPVVPIRPGSSPGRTRPSGSGAIP
jgi:membrane-associated protease RseP (regulator of RpoE activity)